MKAIYIALGANLSNPKETFSKSLQSLGDKGVGVVKMSGLWKSPAWPSGSGQPDYINGCAAVSYNGTAAELLQVLHSVESQYGRIRSIKNAPRILDLDILDFKGQIISDEAVSIPHPRMLSRGFVLFPLAEIAPEWRDPTNGMHIRKWIARLPLKDVLPMQRLESL